MRQFFLFFIFLGLFVCQQDEQKRKEEKESEDLDYQIWDLMDQAHELFGKDQTWFDIFGVDEYKADANEIQSSFKKLSRKLHPDKNPDDPKAAKKFQVLGQLNHILKFEKTRQRYHYWLDNGIPYWRGRAYYFRKSENLSLFASLMVILGGFSFMQYVSRVVRYFQIKSGLKLLDERRNGPLSRSNSTEQLKVKKQKGKRKNSTDDTKTSSPSLFDDANMKHALDYLVLEKHIPPEMVLDQKQWEIVLKEDFDNDSTKYQPFFPSPFGTAFFMIPVWIVRGTMGLFIKKKEVEHEQKDE